MTRRLPATFLALLVLAAPIAGQPGALNEAALRELATPIAARHKSGDADAAMKEFDSAVKARFGDVSDRPVPVFVSTGVVVLATGPYFNFRSQLQTQIRKMETAEPDYEDAVQIGVIPQTIDAIDFSKIIVRRDGQIVEPIGSTLGPEEMKTRMGAAFTVHSGIVKFPTAAFAPGGVVSVTLIPESGRNIEKKFSDSELRRLR